MLDIRFIRENAERVQQDALNKGYKNADIEAVIALDDERKTLTTKIDELRTRRNQIAASMKNAGGKPSAEQIAEGKKIKEELAVFEKDYRELDEKLTAALKGIPNILQPDVPIGEEGEDDLVKTWGEELFESRKNAEDHLDFANKKGEGNITGLDGLGNLTLHEGNLAEIYGKDWGKGISSDMTSDKWTNMKGEYLLLFYGKNAEEIAGVAEFGKENVSYDDQEVKELFKVVPRNGERNLHYSSSDNIAIGFGGTRGESQK